MKENTYDEVADEYARYLGNREREPFSFYHDLVVPQLLETAGDLTGKIVLDAGCGVGTVSVQLAQRGAVVVAVDVAPNMIRLAKRLYPHEGVQYRVRDLSAWIPEFDCAFDVIVSNLVLNDVPDYQGYIATLGRSIKAGGRVVLSMNNPYSAVIRNKVEHYFDSGRTRLYNMANEGVAVYYFHRTLEDYISAFRDNSLLVRTLRDVHVSAEVAANLPGRYAAIPYSDQYHRFPFFMILELVKIAGSHQT